MAKYHKALYFLSSKQLFHLKNSHFRQYFFHNSQYPSQILIGMCRRYKTCFEGRWRNVNVFFE